MSAVEQLPVIDLDDIPQNEVERIYQHTIERVLEMANTLPDDTDPVRMKDIAALITKARNVRNSVKHLCEDALDQARKERSS